MLHDSQEALRFSAVLNTTKQVDADRKFVIHYFLADDTIQVFEPHQRNSGIVGGKFLERQRVKRPDGIHYYNTSDLFVGELWGWIDGIILQNALFSLIMSFNRGLRLGAELDLHR